MIPTTQNLTVRNTLQDQELLNEIRDQFNINCDLDYIFNRAIFYLERYTHQSYTMDDLYQLIKNLDEKSIMYVKSFLLKTIIKNHPEFNPLTYFYPKAILEHIVPAEDWEIIQYPQKFFFSQEFWDKRKKYNLGQYYSLIVYDAGVKFLPESVIPKIKDGVIIDGGSLDAETAIVLSNYTDKKVYTFDFMPKHLTLMRDKISSCHMEDKVEIVELGISDENSSFAMQNTDVTNGSATLVGLDASTQAQSGYFLVETTTLDSFIQTKNIDKVSLIKLDIKGFGRIKRSLKTCHITQKKSWSK